MIKLLHLSILLLSMLLGGALASGIFCLCQRRRAGIPWAKGPRSRCDSCGHQLTPIDLIPVLSYVLLKGKCRTCKAEIPPNGYYVEVGWSIITGFLSIFCLNQYERPGMCVITVIVGILAALIILACNIPEQKEAVKK